jgi:hypothetical protein
LERKIPEKYLKRYSVKELSILYNVSPKLIRTWLRNDHEIGSPRGWYYSPAQAILIFNKLGYPEKFFED